MSSSSPLFEYACEVEREPAKGGLLLTIKTSSLYCTSTADESEVVLEVITEFMACCHCQMLLVELSSSVALRS